MADAVQWTIDQFWTQLQTLKSRITQVDVALQGDKARLTALYSAAKARKDPRLDTLTPLIHRNSELRLSYLQPIKDKFNAAVAAASSMIRGAGYTAPTLSGLGALPLVPVVAATAVVVALAAVAIVWRLTQSQIDRTASMAKIFADPTTTPEQKLALSQAQAAQVDKENKAAPPPLGFNFGDVMPLAAIVAVIVLGPQILSMLPIRRRAAA